MFYTIVIVLFVLSSVVLCDEVLAKQKRYLVKSESGNHHHHHGYSFNGAKRINVNMQYYHHAHQPVHHQHHDLSNQQQQQYHHHSNNKHTHDEHHKHKIKKITYTKKVPVPYEVIVEKKVPYRVEVPVDKPYKVYIPKPYPVYVEMKVPYKVEIPVPQPYTVEKKVTVPIKVPVDKPYPVYVPKPYKVFIEKRVPYILEKHVPYPVKVPIEKPYPVHVKVEKEIPYNVERIVPYPVKVAVDKPIPVHVEKPVPVKIEKPVLYQVEKLVPYPVKVLVKIPVKVPYLIPVQNYESNLGNINSGITNSHETFGDRNSANGSSYNIESGFYGRTRTWDGEDLEYSNESENGHNVGGGTSFGANPDEYYGFEMLHLGGPGFEIGHYARSITDLTNSPHSSRFESDHNSGHGNSHKRESITDEENTNHSYQQSADSNDQQLGGHSLRFNYNVDNSGGSNNFENNEYHINGNTDGKSSVQPYGYQIHENHLEDSSSAGSEDSSGNPEHFVAECNTGNSEILQEYENNETKSGENSSTSYGLKSNQHYQSVNPIDNNTYFPRESNKMSYYFIPRTSSDDDIKKRNWGSIATSDSSSYSFVSGSHLHGRSFSIERTIVPENFTRINLDELKSKTNTTRLSVNKEESDNSSFTSDSGGTKNPIKT